MYRFSKIARSVLIVLAGCTFLVLPHSTAFSADLNLKKTAVEVRSIQGLRIEDPSRPEGKQEIKAEELSKSDKVPKSEEEINKEVSRRIEEIKVEKEKENQKIFGYQYFTPARNRILQMESGFTGGQSLTGQENTEVGGLKTGSVSDGASVSDGLTEPQTQSERKTEVGGLKADSVSNGLIKPQTQSERKSAIHGYVGPLEMVSSSFDVTVPRSYILSTGDTLRANFWEKTIDPIEVKLVIDKRGYVTVPKLGKIMAQGLTLEMLQQGLSLMYEKSRYKYMKFMITLDELKSIRVSIQGEVFRPGNYAVSSVTTLFNALYACGGVSEIGSLRNIRLLRGRKTLHIDFYDFLLNGNSQDDFLLQSGDIIQVPLVKKSVTLQGEVVRPVIYELKNNENLTDLLKMAGGIKPTGIQDKIQIETVLPNKERRIIDVDLSQSGKSVPTELNNGDIVTVRQISAEIKNSVRLEGAVDRPGLFELKKEMRVADLFSEQNRPLEEAYLDRVDIVRFKNDGKTTFLIPIRLDKALEKDPDHNIQLQEMDRVIVYSKWDVQFISPHTVTIYGAVQRPGQYHRTKELDLKTLLFVTGGALPGYYKQVEVVRSSVGNYVEIFKKDIDRLLEGDESQNMILRDDDVVMVKKMSEFFEKPYLVTITGEVKYPGVYALKSKSDRISEIFERAGGITEFAYPKGAVFKRKKELIPSTEMRDDLGFVNKMFERINELEYDRQLARNQYLWGNQGSDTAQPIMSQTAAAGIAGSTNVSEETAKKAAMAPAIAQSAGAATESAFEAFQTRPAVVSKARSLGDDELIPTERVILDLIAARSSPTDQNNLILMDGDTIDIPRKPTTIDIIGAVVRPRTIVYKSSQLDFYINQAGGYNIDADQKQAVVFRIDGSIIPTEEIDEIETGDIIFVPPK
ncbi:MAG: SLBB domain-containing protein, partial [SAR324 cluster bacterium]|nr:SLBB domain-containing protein [SAR324 cluster bacterium]